MSAENCKPEEKRMFTIIFSSPKTAIDPFNFSGFQYDRVKWIKDFDCLLIGADGLDYGPFEAGDGAVLTHDDALKMAGRGLLEIVREGVDKEDLDELEKLSLQRGKCEICGHVPEFKRLTAIRRAMAKHFLWHKDVWPRISQKKGNGTQLHST